MYVLTECAFLTPRSSAIWLDSVRKKHGEIMKCLMISGPISQRKTLKLFRVISKHFQVKKYNWLRNETTNTTLFYLTLFTLVKTCYNCGLSFNSLYGW